MANYISVEKRSRIFHLLCEGNGIRTISRLIGCSLNTVTELRKRYSYIVDYINRKHITDLSFQTIHADEIKTFIRTANNPKWVFISMDSESRLVINFHIGDRGMKDAKKFLTELSYKLNSQADVVTDLLISYIASVKKTPYGRIESAIKNINLLSSNPDNNMHRLNNKIETQNGTVRQHVSALRRKTRGFSKCEEGLHQLLTLWFFYYNFMMKQKGIKTCPAVSAGLIDKPFTFDIILEYDLIFTETFTHIDKSNFGRTRTKTKVRSISNQDADDFINDASFLDGMKKGTSKTTYKAKVVSL